jgi:hypothetical protein
MSHYSATWGSMVRRAVEWAAALMVLAAILPSWRILYPNSGIFEGRGAVVGRDVPGGLEGVADDDPYEVQWQAWRRPVPACLTVPELLPQCPAWGCMRGGVRLQLTVAGMASRRPSVTTWPCKTTGKHFEGVAGPPSRARHVSRTGVGSAASQG